MQINEIQSRLRTFIRQRFGIPEDDPDFTDDIDLYNYGYVDSFGAVDLNTFVAAEFSIQLGDSDLVSSPLNTIREISEFVVRRQKGEI